MAEAAAHGHTNAAASNRWSAGDFLGSKAVILACLLALAGALLAAARYLLRRHCRRRQRRDEEKPPPALVYSSASKLEDCAICLEEFADGDAVRAMPACDHVFHARCIDRWLAGAGRRPSCPTCRAAVLNLDDAKLRARALPLVNP